MFDFRTEAIKKLLEVYSKTTTATFASENDVPVLMARYTKELTDLDDVELFDTLVQEVHYHGFVAGGYDYESHY